LSFTSKDSDHHNRHASTMTGFTDRRNVAILFAAIFLFGGTMMVAFNVEKVGSIAGFGFGVACWTGATMMILAAFAADNHTKLAKVAVDGDRELAEMMGEMRSRLAGLEQSLAIAEKNIITRLESLESVERATSDMLNGMVRGAGDELSNRRRS
jgi:hypothetical protein